MRLLFAKHFWLYIFLLVAVAVSGWFIWREYNIANEPPPETTAVQLGDVRKTITISGKIEALQVARLGFPVNGTIRNIYKQAGESVAPGEIIATLTNDAAIADYNAALEGVRYAEQVKQQLLRGATAEERAVASTNVTTARIALERTRSDFAQAVANARKNLLSANLFAYPTDPENRNTPPTITGNYLCAEEGRYIISLYSSSAVSGRSYRLSGLESGTFAATMDTAQPLGTCGLYMQLTASEFYRNDDWIIEIPNRRGASYVSLRNAYNSSQLEERNAVRAAEENLRLAERTEAVLLAPPTRETLAQAEANLAMAESRLGASVARVSDYTIRAPFAGSISEVAMKVGETTNSDKTITIIYEGDYELRANIPEVDITKINVGDTALVTFDANPASQHEATISFISPLSTRIGGVAYFEAHFTLAEIPTWLREGLNADVAIESERKIAVPTLPKRFIELVGNESFVYTLQDNQPTKTPVSIGLVGTDGTTELLDLPVGTVVVLP